MDPITADEVRPRAERGPAHPLQEPRLAADDERDRERRERVGGHPVPEQADQEVGGRVHPLDRLVPVHRADEDEQQDREEEAEECRLAVPPEEELLHAELVQVEPHSTASSLRQLEVDVLEAPAVHLEPFQLDALRQRLRRQLVQDPRRLLGGDDDLACRCGGSGSPQRRARREAPAGEPVPTISPPRRMATRSASCCASSM